MKQLFEVFYGLAVTRPETNTDLKKMQLEQAKLQMEVDVMTSIKVGVPNKTTYSPCKGCGSSDFIARPLGMTCTYCRALQ